MYIKKFRHKIKSGDVALYRTLLNGWPKEERFKHLDDGQPNRERISKMMLAAHKHPKAHIPKKLLYQHIPEDQWELAAHALVDNNFNENRLFWHYVDRMEDTIKLALPLFFLHLILPFYAMIT